MGKYIAVAIVFYPISTMSGYAKAILGFGLPLTLQYTVRIAIFAFLVENMDIAVGNFNSISSTISIDQYEVFPVWRLLYWISDFRSHCAVRICYI